MEITRARSSIVCILLLLSLSFAPCAFSKSLRPISDAEIREKKGECYTDIVSGLWGWHCTSSPIAKENCAINSFMRAIRLKKAKKIWLGAKNTNIACTSLRSGKA